MFLLLITLVSANVCMNAQTTADEKAALALFTQATADFGALDAKAFAANFTTDATLVNPAGTVFHGQQAILEAHTYYFSTDAAKAEGGGDSEFENIVFESISDELLYATLTANWIFEGQTVGSDVFGLMFKKTKDGWRIHHGQMTHIPNQAPNN